MKRLLFFLLCFCTLCSVKAAVVDQNSAERYAMDRVMPSIQGASGILSTEKVYQDGILVYYIINFDPCGWALVSASDAVVPLIGYNTDGHFTISQDIVNLTSWMNDYATQIADAIRFNDKSLPVEENAERVSTRASADIVEPLIKVNWNQGNPYYQFCPAIGGKHVYVGCVAVGMAQAMSVARWPKRPSGTFSYDHGSLGTISIDYDLEDPYDWTKIIAGDDNKVWVAHLLYHCGVAVKMDYGLDGSGAMSSAIATALKRNFSYPECTMWYPRANYTLSEWKEMLVEELKAGRAVIYAAQDTKNGYGHCFNIDGYDGSAMFHLNWGWGGTGNGYFTIDGLRDAHMNMNYDLHRGMVLGVRKPTTAPTDILLDTQSVPAGVAANTEVIVPKVESESEDAKFTLTITGTYNIITRKYNTVPFTISRFTGAIATTKVLGVGEKYDVIIKAFNNSTNESLEKSFVLTVVDGTGAISVEESHLTDIYYTLSGAIIHDDLNNLPSGMYLKSSVGADGKVITKKIYVNND